MKKYFIHIGVLIISMAMAGISMTKGGDRSDRYPDMDQIFSLHLVSAHSNQGYSLVGSKDTTFPPSGNEQKSTLPAEPVSDSNHHSLNWDYQRSELPKDTTSQFLNLQNDSLKTDSEPALDSTSER